MNSTHLGCAVMLQVTLAPGVEPSSLSALTVTLQSESPQVHAFMVNVVAI